MKIYQDFGVKIIYKDITEKDLNKNWTNGGVGSSSRVFENCLNDEMGAFYITFMKNHIFPYLNREVTDRVFPMYWYMVYNYSLPLYREYWNIMLHCPSMMTAKPTAG